MIPFNGQAEGRPIRTGVRDLLRELQLSLASPSAWLPDRNEILFSATAGDTINVWRIALSPQTWQPTAPPTRLTFGTGLEFQAALVPVVNRSGAAGSVRLVFSNLNENVDIWALPIAVGEDAAAVAPKRLTHDANIDVFPAISRDGRTMAFASRRLGNSGIWVKDLENSTETPIVSTPWNESRPTLTPEATKVAYEIKPDPKSQSCQVVTLGPTRRDVRETAIPQRLPDNCWRPWSWSSDGSKLLYLVAERRHHVDEFNITSGETRTLLESPKYNLYHAYFSPDDRWLTFIANVGRSRSPVVVAPYRSDAPVDETSWIYVTNGESADDKPRWSVDGKRIYYTSNVDGFRCIWARNLHPFTKRPFGAPFAIYHAHTARLSIGNVGVDPTELGVASDKLVFR